MGGFFMHIRMLQDRDVTDIVDLIYDVYEGAQYTEGSGPLAPQAVKATILEALNRPDYFPCFVHDAPDGSGDRLSGFLYGHVVTTLFDNERWFREQVFYVRPTHRSLQLATAFVTAVEEWCRENKIVRVELGNGVSQDLRINRLYRRLGYDPVNTTYARRL